LGFTGTPGVLLKAKNAGLIEALLPLVARMEELGFHLAEPTRIEFLNLAGES
jgi:predicted nucleic acid-binding protein